MSNKNNGIDKYKNMMKPKEQGSVYDQFIGPIEKDIDKDNIKDNIDNNDVDNTIQSDNISDNASVNVSLSSIPIAKSKRSIRETHKTKAFYIRNDIAKLIDKDIKTSRRGAMTEIVNALFEEYYKSQGRLK